jgi:hypothetical protein
VKTYNHDSKSGQGGKRLSVANGGLAVASFNSFLLTRNLRLLSLPQLVPRSNRKNWFNSAERNITS